MDQIIIDGVRLPEVSRDNYFCWEDDLSVQVDMISGRRVVETRGKVWRVSYSYDYMGNACYVKPWPCCDPGSLSSARCCRTIPTKSWCPGFWWSGWTRLKCFSRRDNAFWHQISFTLREEKPH